MRGPTTLLLMISSVCAAQTSTGNLLAMHQTSSSPKNQARLSAAGLPVEGLVHADLLKKFYVGDFTGISNDDPVVGVLFSHYLRAFGEQCSEALPTNKVEIIERVCTRHRYPIDRFGNKLPGWGTCSNYEDKGTGVFADPALYQAEKTFDEENGRRAGIRALRAMKIDPSHPFETYVPAAGEAPEITADLQATKTDLDTMVHRSGCMSPALMQFQTNLQRFALNEAPLDLAGTERRPPAPTALSGKTDYAGLLEDLVAENSKGWIIHRFEPNSVSNIVVSNDAHGAVSKVSAQYMYNRTYRGSTVLTFSNGAPACLVFGDAPLNCNPPDRAVVSAYLQGKYQR